MYVCNFKVFETILYNISRKLAGTVLGKEISVSCTVQLQFMHGFYIRWLLISLCAHKE